MLKTVRDFNVINQRVLVRTDFNVPLSEQGNILDNFRIKETIPTIEYLIKKEAKVILMSHLGRPFEGQGPSLEVVARELGKLLQKEVKFLNDCAGEQIEKETEKMMMGDIILLENLRFHKEEKENDDNFAKDLAKLGDIYINDAFGACHRAHASIVGIPKYLPAGAGLLLEKEVKVLTGLMENSRKPLLAIIGGKKVETKTKLIDKISEIANWILVGGLIKKEIEEKAIALKNPQKILGPVDNINEKDIGPQTINLFKEKILQARTIFWSGPLGAIEEEEFSGGSAEIAKAVIKSGAFSIIGGGETVEFINRLGLVKKFNHASTGGGAMLKFLSGEKLPGVEALK